jgi:hypothetical protein
MNAKGEALVFLGNLYGISGSGYACEQNEVRREEFHFAKCDAYIHQ